MGQQSRSEDRFVRLLIPKHPPLPRDLFIPIFPPSRKSPPPALLWWDFPGESQMVPLHPHVPVPPFLPFFFSCFSSLCHSLSLPFSSSSAIISLIPMAVICEDYWRWWCVLCLCVCVCGRGGGLHSPRGLLSIQGHRLTKRTLQRIECFTRHVMFCNFWWASLQIW